MIHRWPKNLFLIPQINRSDLIAWTLVKKQKKNNNTKPKCFIEQLQKYLGQRLDKYGCTYRAGVLVEEIASYRPFT